MTEPFEIRRRLVIAAPASTVFRYFTDSGRFAAWWGPGSTIEPREGGAVRICYPGGEVASGVVLELVPDRRLRFSYGYENPSKPIKPGGSVVLIELSPASGGTALTLLHTVDSAAIRDAHVPGWRYQLAVFAHVVAKEQHAEATARVDRYFAAWAEADPTARAAILAEATADDVSFRDPYGATQGRAELVDHIGAARLHLGALVLSREGMVRQGDDLGVVSWVAKDASGKPAAKGENLLCFAPDGKILRIVGVWS